jgi:hypothetical protein
VLLLLFGGARHGATEDENEDEKCQALHFAIVFRD